MKYKSKTTLVYLSEFFIPTIIAAILLWFDQRIFFLFFFFYVIWAIDRRIDYLRKIIRIRSLQIETKIEAIIKHLNIPDKKVANNLMIKPCIICNILVIITSF